MPAEAFTVRFSRPAPGDGYFATVWVTANGGARTVVFYDAPRPEPQAAEPPESWEGTD